MRRLAISTILAGGLFMGVLGAAGSAHATEANDPTPNRNLEAPALIDFGGTVNPTLGMGSAVGMGGMGGMGFGF